MAITKASENQIDAILSLCKECSQNMLNNSLDQWDEVYPNREIFLNDIKNDSLFIANYDNSKEIIGCVVLNEYQDPEYGDIEWKHDGENIAVIHRLMVHPKYEGRGIAKSLVGFAEELAQKGQYDSVRLDVFQKNQRAVNFYHKLGYTVSGKVTFRKGKFWCCEKPLTRKVNKYGGL